MYGSFLSLAHRETVLVDTWSTRATSAVRRYSLLRTAVRTSAIVSPLLEAPWSRRSRRPVRLNIRPFRAEKSWTVRIKLKDPIRVAIWSYPGRVSQGDDAC